MPHSLNDRVLTFAGIFQAAALVRRTATQGRKVDTDIETCINSLFQINVASVEEIYQHSSHLRLGLSTLVAQIGSNSGHRDSEITRYVITLLHLEKKLSQRQDLLDTIADGIKTASSQVNYFSLMHESVIASLADLYQNTISTLNPKIIVSGEQGLLQDTDNANLIRALLLCGIRSAMAWRQCGGSRWALLFKRRAILSEAKSILEKLPSIDTRV